MTEKIRLRKIGRFEAADWGLWPPNADPAWLASRSDLGAAFGPTPEEACRSLFDRLIIPARWPNPLILRAGCEAEPFVAISRYGTKDNA